jgi:hypothetical protein
MTSLLDIAPLRMRVKIGHAEIECQGISAEDLVRLVDRFPALGKRLFPGAATPSAGDIDAGSLLAAVPQAVHAIIAIGTGNGGKPEEEAAAARLPVGVQTDLLEAIIELSLPGGIVPFVERLTSLFGVNVRELTPPASADVRPALPNGSISEAPASDTDLQSRLNI